MWREIVREYIEKDSMYPDLSTLLMTCKSNIEPPWTFHHAPLMQKKTMNHKDISSCSAFSHPEFGDVWHFIWNSYSYSLHFVVISCDKIYRVQQESAEDGERNHFLVNYVDYAFDDFGGRQPPVYPGLSTVWGSLARSKVVWLSFVFAIG